MCCFILLYLKTTVIKFGEDTTFVDCRWTTTFTHNDSQGFLIKQHPLTLVVNQNWLVIGQLYCSDVCMHCAPWPFYSLWPGNAYMRHCTWSSIWHQAISWTNDGLLSIGPLGTKLGDIFIESKTFALTKLHLKMSSAQVVAILSWPQCVKNSSTYVFVCFSGFDFYGEGEMVLYRHDTLPYEVRPFIRRCGNVACNCAVAVLSGDDVILIESCGPRDAPYPAGTLTVKFYLNGELNPGTSLTRYNGGLKYEVCEQNMQRICYIHRSLRFVQLFFSSIKTIFSNP